MFFGNNTSPKGGDEPSLPKEYQRCEWVGNYEGDSSSGSFISLPWGTDKKMEYLECSFKRFSVPYAKSHLTYSSSFCSMSFLKDSGDFVSTLNTDQIFQANLSYDNLWHKVSLKTTDNLYELFYDNEKVITAISASGSKIGQGNNLNIFRGVYCYFGIDYLSFCIDEVKYNLVACYRKSDDVAGLYDLENKVFYPATNSFKLKHGADKQII